jgi:hypothetical protein
MSCEKSITILFALSFKTGVHGVASGDTLKASTVSCENKSYFFKYQFYFRMCNLNFFYIKVRKLGLK